MAEQCHVVACADLSLARDSEVETGAPALKKALDHSVGSESNAELVAGEPGLGDDDLGGAYLEAVADVDCVLSQPFASCALEREVFSKGAVGQGMAGQFGLPVRVVLDGIAVDGLECSAVDGEVRLPVSVEIQGSEGDSARDGCLVDGRGHALAVPGDFARQSAMQGDELHSRFGGRGKRESRRRQFQCTEGRRAGGFHPGLISNRPSGPKARGAWRPRRILWWWSRKVGARLVPRSRTRQAGFKSLRRELQEVSFTAPPLPAQSPWGTGC